MRITILFLVLLKVAVLPAQLSDSLSLSAIEQLNFSEASVHTFLEYLDLATRIVDQSGEAGLAGELLLTITSEALKTAIETGRLDPGTNEVAGLIEGYAARGYHVYQPKVPDVVKGLRYCCEGRYAYVFVRLKQRGLFYPFAALVFLILAFLVARWFNWVTWGNRQKINRWFIGITLTLLVMVVVFKLTCAAAITPAQVYGISVR